MEKIKMFLIALIFVFLFLLSKNAFCEEGMWTFDNIPSKQIKKKYGFTPTKTWLNHLRLSSVRFNNGGSGSFISPTGLVLTNHHVASDQLQKLSTPQRNLMDNGFSAATRQDEIPCMGLELNVLTRMEDVTGRVAAAVEGLSGEKALKIRKETIAKIEKEANKKTGLRCDVISLYEGGEYWLYYYKKYKDVRLVLAPERQMGFYGGDDDNFTYPRYALDFTIFRVYEDGKPAKIDNYLSINPGGAKEGDLIFTSGHPGGTDRQQTYYRLLYFRDFSYPQRISLSKRNLKVLEDYSATGAEEKRRALSDIFDIRNALKAEEGELGGLLNPKVMEKCKQSEDDLRQKIDKNPRLKEMVGSSFEDIEKATDKVRKNYYALNFRRLWGGDLAIKASSMVFYAKEIQKPDIERLNGYHDAQLDSWKFDILSESPIFKDMQTVLLADALRYSLEKLGPDDKGVKILLEGKSPEERAKELMEGTRLNDPAFRKSLVDGGPQAILKSDDPLIQLAVKMEPIRREMIKWREKHFESVVTPAYEKIARARFAIYGKETYPDATFTLRLSFGSVKGYPMNGTVAPPFTTFYGLYDRYYSFLGHEAWNLPEAFLKGRDSLNLSLPMNLSCTADVVGGNSGSPVVDKDCRLVGLIFDGNIESLVGNFVYYEENNRAIALETPALLEVLEKIYKGKSLVKEMLGE